MGDSCRTASAPPGKIAAAPRYVALLPRHGHVDGFLRRDQVIDAHSILGDGQLNALHPARKFIAARPVVRRHRGSRVHSNVAAVIGGEDHGCRGADLALADLLAIQVFRIRGVAWTAQSAGGAKACVVNQDDQDVWRSLGRTQLCDRRELGVRILRIIRDQACPRSIRDGKDIAFNILWRPKI